MELLEGLTVAQLKSLAAERNIDLEGEVTGVMAKLNLLGARGKQEIVMRLFNEEKLSDAMIERFVKAGTTSRGGRAEKTTAPAVERPAANGPVPVTPTLAPNRTSAMVSFDEVFAYLQNYQFISRYSDEASYEIELAGALRERFGTVIRQNPVPGTMRLAIDLDVGGVGIEVKHDVNTQKPFQAMKAQLEAYKAHYGEKLIVVLIACYVAEPSKNELKPITPYIVEK